MLVRQMLEIYDLLDTPQASGEAVAALLRERGAQDVTVTVVGGNQGTTDCVKVVIPGRHGKSTGGDAPTLGIVGRLGGIGARPEMIGQVSDGDGALAALTVALKLAEMHHNDDILEGDVIIGTDVEPENLVCVLGFCRQDDDRKRIIFPDFDGCPNPVKMGHHDIHDQQIYWFPGKNIQSLLSVVGFQDVIAFLCKIDFDCFYDFSIVITY